MKVKIFDRFYVKNRGLVFALNLNDNDFEVVDDKYKLVGTKIEVDNKIYVIKEAEKFRCAAPIEWEQDRPIGVVVEEISF